MGYPFNQNSLFPQYDINYIIKMECDLADFFNCYPEFNNMSFYEFIEKLEYAYNKGKDKNIMKELKGFVKE